MGAGLVHHQGYIDGFRASQMIQDKAQSAGNGRVLFKGCNAVLDHPGGSLRASREGVVRCVAPLGKGMPFPARRASRSTASRLADPITITLQEY